MDKTSLTYSTHLAPDPDTGVAIVNLRDYAGRQASEIERDRVERYERNEKPQLLGGPNITSNLYCICLSKHETCAYADVVQICGNI